ncbi:MAG: DoxX family protein [Mariniphaga sp.]
MNRLLSRTLPLANVNAALLILRAGVALLMLTHGYPKLLRLISNEPVTFTAILGMSATLSLVLAVFAEFLCSLLIFFGAATRLASIPLIVTMAVAAFHVHSGDPFSGKEKALLFLLIYLVLLFTGGGKFSIDHLLTKKRLKKRT